MAKTNPATHKLNIMCKLIGHKLAMKDRRVDSFSADVFCMRCGYSKKMGLEVFVDEKNEELRRMIYD